MKIVLFILTVFIAVGCSETSPKLVPFKEDPTEKGSEIADITKESFNQNLDILFVIDDSGSMSSHQANLAANASLFADAILRIKYLDYHVGVITSSASSSFGMTGGGRLFGNPKYIERSTPNGVASLAQNLQPGTGGDASEVFFDPLVLALSPPLINGFNSGFSRQNSYLAVIFVTDTDDQSYKNDAQSTYDFLLNFKGNSNKLFVGAAYISDKDISVCSGESEVSSYDNLPDFFQMTKAITFSLCDPDFGEKLAEIGRLIASRATTMYLKKIPKKGTIKVVVGSMEIPNDPKTGWTYNPVINAIEFGPDIDWDSFPDKAFPQVDFDAIEIEDPALVELVPTNPT